MWAYLYSPRHIHCSCTNGTCTHCHAYQYPILFPGLFCNHFKEFFIHLLIKMSIANVVAKMFAAKKCTCCNRYINVCTYEYLKRQGFQRLDRQFLVNEKPINHCIYKPLLNSCVSNGGIIFSTLDSRKRFTLYRKKNGYKSLMQGAVYARKFISYTHSP